MHSKPDLMADVSAEIRQQGAQGATQPMQPFYALSVLACLDALGSRLDGLTAAEATVRQQSFGNNTLTPTKSRTAGRLFLGQFKNGVVILLFTAALLSFALHQPLNGALILVAVAMNAGIGFLTRWKTQTASLGLGYVSQCQCQVLRGGTAVTVTRDELVPGDILLFSAGQTVAADARLIASEGVQVDESALTGESVLVQKNTDPCVLPGGATDLEITTQSNMLFAGTLVKTGQGKALVTAIGVQSQLGKIAQLAYSASRRPSRLTQSTTRLRNGLLVLVLLLTAVMMAAGLHRGESAAALMQLGIVLIVAAVPEALPAVVTYILTLGVERLTRKKALVRNLHAIEALGDMTVLCTDKTGTLTENALSLHRIYIPDMPPIAYNPAWAEGKDLPNAAVAELLRVGRLNNTTILDGVRSFTMGDPIDVALFRAAPAGLETGYRAIKSLPFDSQAMRMATIVQHNRDRYGAMIKGAPEAVINHCAFYLGADGQVHPLTKEKRISFLLVNQDLAMDGTLRVIGFAQKPLAGPDAEPYENAIFLGWVCLIDPPKAGIRDALRQCQQVGIRLLMITGDQKATAAMLARSLGILHAGEQVWTRSDLDNGIEKLPQTVSVFARTQPEEKLGIVQALQNSGERVAMLGDGVNDTPALRQSDLAIAMGLRAAEAAKESADIVLLNDRLDTLAGAILESRVLVHNVGLATEYLVSCSLGIVLLMTAAELLGHGLPLNVIQVLWLNMAIVTLPALSLAFEPGPKFLKRRPLQTNERASSDRSRFPDKAQLGEFLLMGLWSILLAGCGLGAFILAATLLHQHSDVAGTLAFCTMTLAQTAHLLNIRRLHSGESFSAFLVDAGRTPMTYCLMGFALVSLVLCVYCPPFQWAFHTAGFPPMLWAIPFGLTLAMQGLSMLLVQPQKAEDCGKTARALES